MEDPAAPGTFVQVIHILGNDIDFEMPFQFHQGQVARVRGYLQELPAALVVKFQHQGRVPGITFRGSHLHDVMAFP
jgi:hypothetical protein